MLRFFAPKKLLSLCFSPREKVPVMTSYININIVPKKNSSAYVARCLKPCVTSYKCSNAIPTIWTRSFQPVGVWKELIHVRLFHTSPTRRAIPPLILIIIRPVVKLAAMIFGRTLRKWWQSLPSDKKAAFMSKLKKYRVHIAGFVTVMSMTLVHYYFSHLEQDPITKRWRFMIFTHKQMKQIADLELEVLIEQYQGYFLHASDKNFQRVVQIANRILAANRDIPGLPDTSWHVTIVNHPTLRNAFVLPNGTIFIFMGMVDLCDNDDQLGIILAHEMAHALLGHMAEQMSSVQVIEWLLLIPLVIIWALLPDGAAILSQWLSGHFANLALHLPFSRYIETEADQVGLQLAAKACFDVREATVFWNKMATLDKESGGFENVEWLSTHPSHETRELFLEIMLPQVLKLREECNCPPLKSCNQPVTWKARKIVTRDLTVKK